MVRQPLKEQSKQISIFVPLSDWKAIRMEAARRHVPMTELCRQWLRPELSQLGHDQRESNGRM